MKKVIFVLISCCILSLPVLPCTIFVLTDGSRALFFNNEDWSNPRTRIWFAPGVGGRYGAAYVGFDDGYSQGGLNSKGLAFDWVAGFAEESQRDPSMQPTHGYPTQRMLETSATVDEATAYYRNKAAASAIAAQSYLYFNPKYEEFQPRTMWSLSNAFTSAFKELDPIPQFKATAKLGEFLPTTAAVAV